VNLSRGNEKPYAFTLCGYRALKSPAPAHSTSDHGPEKVRETTLAQGSRD
jgi:hypothetical protein